MPYLCLRQPIRRKYLSPLNPAAFLFVFAKATTEELIHALTRIVKKEKISIEPDALALIAGSVDGSFRDGVKFLEQVSFHKGKITTSTVRSILVLTEEKTIDIFLTHLAEKNTKEALRTITRLTSEGNDIKTFITDCLMVLERKLVDHIQGAALPGWKKDDLLTVIRKLSQAYVEMKGTAISELPLELAVVEFCEEFPSKDSSPLPSIVQNLRLLPRLHLVPPQVNLSLILLDSR